MRPGKSDGRREKETYVASKAIVGEKVGMTQVWDDQNRAVPVTVLKVAPVRVVQVKTPETDGYAALQVTWGFRRNSTIIAKAASTARVPLRSPRSSTTSAVSSTRKAAA